MIYFQYYVGDLHSVFLLVLGLSIPLKMSGWKINFHLRCLAKFLWILIFDEHGV